MHELKNQLKKQKILAINCWGNGLLPDSPVTFTEINFISNPDDNQHEQQQGIFKLLEKHNDAFMHDAGFTPLMR